VRRFFADSNAACLLERQRQRSNRQPPSSRFNVFWVKTSRIVFRTLGTAASSSFSVIFPKLALRLVEKTWSPHSSATVVVNHLAALVRSVGAPSRSTLAGLCTERPTPTRPPILVAAHFPRLRHLRVASFSTTGASGSRSLTALARPSSSRAVCSTIFPRASTQARSSCRSFLETLFFFLFQGQSSPQGHSLASTPLLSSWKTFPVTQVRHRSPWAAGKQGPLHHSRLNPVPAWALSATAPSIINPQPGLVLTPAADISSSQTSHIFNPGEPGLREAKVSNGFNWLWAEKLNNGLA
jgi:hypothetical protein